jgi:hypothetical protein
VVRSSVQKLKQRPRGVEAVAARSPVEYLGLPGSIRICGAHPRAGLRLHDDATTDFLGVIGGLMGSVFHLVNNMLGLPWLASVASTQERGSMK